MRSTDDPIQNMLSQAGAAAAGSDAFYSPGNRTDAFWNAARDAQAQRPGSGIGLDAYRITNVFNPRGPYLAGQGQAQGIYSTTPSAGAQGSPAPTASPGEGAEQRGGSDTTGLIVVAVIVVLLLSR